MVYQIVVLIGSIKLNNSPLNIYVTFNFLINWKIQFFPFSTKSNNADTNTDSRHLLTNEEIFL